MGNEFQKRVKVLDYPETFILIDSDKDEAEAKAHWLLKWKSLNKSISKNQIRRERVSIRGGKVLHRTKYK